MHPHTHARVHPHKTIIRQLFLHLRIQIQRSWPVKLQQTLSMRQISDDTPAHHVWLQRDQWFIWLRWSTHRGSEPSTNTPRLVTKRPVVHLTQMEHSLWIWTLNQCTTSGYKETSGSFDSDGALTVDLKPQPMHHVWLQRDQWFIWLRWSTQWGPEPSFGPCPWRQQSRLKYQTLSQVALVFIMSKT